MYIFDILKKIINIDENVSILKNKIIKSLEGSEEINEIELQIPTITDIISSNIETNNQSLSNINNIKNSINMYNNLLNSIYTENDLNYNTAKDISEIYQFTQLMSYTNQYFKFNNNNVKFIEKININNKDIMLFNSMISSDKYTRNQVIIYKTYINDNGIFKHEMIPFIENNGFYYFNIKIELEKIESLDSEVSKYKIKDKNEYITCIAYQNSIWEDEDKNE